MINAGKTILAALITSYKVENHYAVNGDYLSSNTERINKHKEVTFRFYANIKKPRQQTFTTVSLKFYLN